MVFAISLAEIKKIKIQIGEDENRLQHIENLLQKWISTENHLPNNYDHNLVRNFIRGSKFNLETTKRKLEGYLLAKSEFPEFYADRNPNSNEIQDVYQFVNIAFLPRLSENGERIVVLSVEKNDSNFPMETVLKLFWMIYDFILSLHFPATGEILIFDVSNVSTNIFAKTLSSHFKNSITIFREAYAARINQVHILNCPPFAEKIIASLKPLVHAKVRDRVIIHKSCDSLGEYLSPKLLPSDFGGYLENVRSYMELWKKQLEENCEWFQTQENVKIIGKPPKNIKKFGGDILGQGSFRQLNID